MWMELVWTVLWGEAVLWGCLAAARRLDGEAFPGAGRRERILWTLLCAGNGVLIVLLGERAGEDVRPAAPLLGAAAGGLLAACRMDRVCCMVYDFVWWPVLMAGAGLWWGVGTGMGTGSRGDWRALLFFVLLQRCLFARFYGRADVYGFCACALLLGAQGAGLLEYLLHMGLAFLMLAAVQGVGHNIGADGNLRRPVPFLPYIIASFWMFLLMFSENRDCFFGGKVL